jgi:ribonuclease HIII
MVSPSTGAAAAGAAAAGMRRYAVPDAAARRRVEAALRARDGWTERPEQSCAFRLDFAERGERVVVKQYTNGTLLLVGGAPGPLLESLAAAVAAAGAVPGAGAPKSGAPSSSRPGSRPTGPRGGSTGVDVTRPFDSPWIGSDESGKGDYFGPLVACAVYADDRILGLLAALGVQDSKRLTDVQNRRLAGEVRAVCDPGYAEVVVPPERYNALYEQFRREGKNLNTLLAWGHARAIETVLQRVPCENVIVDQFADARYIRSRLQGREATGHLNIVQLPRAEANLAVAAASVLARDRFLGWLEQAGRSLGKPLPKGASSQVEAAARALVAAHGADALGRAAKLHFKTTERVLGRAAPAPAAGG